MRFFLFFLAFWPFFKAVQALNCTTPVGVLTDPVGEGVLCKECNYRGRVVTEFSCNCTDSNFDPQDSCLRPGETLPVPDSEFVSQSGLAECSCFTNYQDGFWRRTTNYSITPSPQDITESLSNSAAHVYGQPLPPQCDECFSDLYGPKPGTVTADLQLRTNNVACTEYGWSDPNVLFQLNPFLFLLETTGRRRELLGERREPEEGLTWASCGGHGTWTGQGCDCSLGWGRLPRSDIPFDYFGNLAPICIQCQGPWGPPVPWGQSAFPQRGPPFCAFPWTPDPVDGTLKQCSGHGDFLNNECRCYQNSTAGYWEIGTYEMQQGDLKQDGTIVVETYTVETCLGCVEGVQFPFSGCLTNTTQPPTFPTESPTPSPTFSPSLSPTFSPTPPTNSPTASPTNSPTLSPTLSPTKSPTITPTRSPSISPTISPTRSPTTSPTLSPSQAPTMSPTAVCLACVTCS